MRHRYSLHVMINNY